jgi:hypothetical protein
MNGGNSSSAIISPTITVDSAGTEPNSEGSDNNISSPITPRSEPEDQEPNDRITQIDNSQLGRIQGDRLSIFLRILREELDIIDSI